MCPVEVKINPSAFFCPKLDIDPDLTVFMHSICY